MSEEKKTQGEPIVTEEREPSYKIIDLGKELYDGDNADVTKIREYVDIAKEKIGGTESLDLTGRTMMAIYTAVSAEMGKSETIKEFAFNAPAREGRLVLWSEEISKGAPEKPTKSLMMEAPASVLDPEAPMEVLDLRLTFANDPEAMQQMADVKKASEYMKEIVAQLRELKNKGQKVVRITGIPMWLAQGAYFAAVREEMERLISYTLASEMIIYDRNNSDLVGKTKIETPIDIVIDLGDKKIDSLDSVNSGKELQKMLGEEVKISHNKIELTNINLENIPPHVALRMFDSFHSFSVSLTMAGIEVFQHLNTRTPNLVQQIKQSGAELLPQGQRVALTLDVHSALEQNDNDPEKTALELAKEVARKASQLIFSGITNLQELAIAGRVAHAAHGSIEELKYKGNKGDEMVSIKKWVV